MNVEHMLSWRHTCDIPCTLKLYVNCYF